MGFFSRKEQDPVLELDVAKIERGRPHPYVMHTDIANRDHTSCVVCGQEPGDVLHIPLSEYKAQVQAQPEPAYGEIRWS